MNARALILGDVVGKPGRRAATEIARRMRREQSVDIIIVNGENAAAGSGLTPKILKQFFEAGIDVVTAGDHIYRNREVEAVIETERRLIRPANYPKGAPGFGLGVFTTPTGVTFGVTAVVGRTFMDPADDPFAAVDAAVEELAKGAKLIFVDAHCEATSESIALGWHLCDRVACVYGTHTHVATADERVLDGGTAYITDLGMTGAHDGILGRNREAVLKHMRLRVPTRFEVSKGDIRANGILVEADAETGRALSIERFEEKFKATPAADPKTPKQS